MDPAVWPKIPGGHTAELVPEGRGAQGEINNKGPQGGGGQHYRESKIPFIFACHNSYVLTC